jgi:hypothetical protein
MPDIQNPEISCLKSCLAIPIDRALVSGVGQVTTINCREAVHAFRCGINNGCWVGVFAVADQAVALVSTKHRARSIEGMLLHGLQGRPVGGRVFFTYGRLSMRFILVSAVASAVVFGTCGLAMAEESLSLGSELKQEMGSMASEAKGEMQAEQEQGRDNFKSKQDQLKADMKSKKDQMKSEMKAKRDALKAEKKEMKKTAKAKKANAKKNAKDAAEPPAPSTY